MTDNENKRKMPLPEIGRVMNDRIMFRWLKEQHEFALIVAEVSQLTFSQIIRAGIMMECNRLMAGMSDYQIEYIWEQFDKMQFDGHVQFKQRTRNSEFLKELATHDEPTD